ncbi:lysophospholipid acyltransferase family protein [Oleisolibacter albus]|uniref:lysophospholipid acyltransferase family protein n=1 Tax=Oleisolibacter albus TaxID=2171757 RepID=UPI000DF43241|nr:lysophospholipid acyltransferase family protein [Oleisolibacter albus]
MDIGSSLRGIVRLVIYGIWTAACIPVQAVILACRLPVDHRFPRFYHGVCCRMLGIEVVVRGTPSRVQPTLFISNHSSYLDIPVLGSQLPVSFVAKAEVAGWPLFGLLAKLQQTVFIQREQRQKAQEQRDSMAGRLQSGDNLVLFPEGTSSDGNRTLPFKTALFAVASTRIDGAPVTVQPVSVTATHLDGLPLGHIWRSLYAWYADMELPPHLWRMVRAGRLRVTVEFHAPVTVEQFSSRKALADHCWQQVAAGVDRAVAGRADRPTTITVEQPGSVEEAYAG